MHSPDATRIPRRAVLKWFAAATAAAGTPDILAAAASAPSPAKGYGMDPDLSKFYQPGAFWPLTFTPAQRATVVSLIDLILPADHLGPAASEVRVHDYLDEWISAPYPAQQKDRDVLLPGLEWLEAESNKRFQTGFAHLTDPQKHSLCDDICFVPNAKPEFKKAAVFFAKIRTLAASAYYGTEAGWKALGYVGNVTLATFDGPPPEVLKILGVEQTVK